MHFYFQIAIIIIKIIIIIICDFALYNYAIELDFAKIILNHFASHAVKGGGRVELWCWINFQCMGVLLILIVVGQGPTALAVGAGGGCLDIYLSSIISFFSLSLSLGDGQI